MGNSIFEIGLRGLNAAQTGMVTTGHNISNANTPGFHRQEMLQSAATPQMFGGYFLGQGVNVDTVKRVYSQFLDNQVSQAQTQSSSLETYWTQIKQIDNMLADANAGLSPALQDFFTSVNGVSSAPASVPSRQSLLSGAQGMVARFQLLNDRFQQIRDGVNGQITSSVNVISSYAQQIANLNKQIMLAKGANNLPSSDLLDQRDQLVADLNKEIKVSVVIQSNGDYNVFIGNGQSLVVGQQAFTLAAVPAPDDPSGVDVAVKTGTATIILSAESLQGGNLGGLLAFRSETLDSAQNGLGRVAIGLAKTFNDQHQLGQDANGALGGDFFTVASPNTIPNANNTSAGAIAASFSDVGLITTSDYRLQADGGGNYTLIRLSDNTTLFSAAALPQTVDGLTISETVAGALAGESWLIQPTRNGARDIGVAITDSAKIAAAAPIRTSAALTNAGSATISAGTVNTGTPVTPDPLHPTTDLNLQQPVTITFHTPYDGQFDVTGVGAGLPAINQVYTPGGNISFNGWTVQIAGTAAAGDTFTVGPNTGGVADNRNAQLLSALQTRSTLAGNTASYQEAYSQVVSQVGNKSRETEVTAKAQANLVTESRKTQQSLSGVNLDEEAANLLRYQQAYQASGKMIQIASTLFETLLSLGQK
ncbi:MAG: flagellar hook-associated protein FlgK [Pseudomonadota bacterium]